MGMPMKRMIGLVVLVMAAHASAVNWQHPAGLVTNQSIAEVQAKLRDQEWARKAYAARKATLDQWLSIPSPKLAAVFPKKRGNVYHNFSCPTDRCRLVFDAFNDALFKCPVCGKTFAPQTNAGIYAPSERYYGTMYDGWICLFYEEAAPVAADLGLAARIENKPAYADRGVEILMLYADTIEHLVTKQDPDPQMRVLLTYHREGDSMVLYSLACAYEMLRDRMAPAQRSRFEKIVLQRILDEVMLEPIYRQDHNNVYNWHLTVVQTALCLEREDLIDFSFGCGKYDRQHQPEHRSINRMAATHFKPDGAYFEMCSGYHLYPLYFFCELAVTSNHLSQMDPQRFPAGQYDLTDPTSPGGRTINNALHWFMSMAPPDRIMPTIGDSMNPRAGMDDYYFTAEVGYRYFNLLEVGDYPSFRQGNRGWTAMLIGSPEIRQHDLPATSSYLSSGWVSLRNKWKGNDVWVGLNALIPGGGHQHADRLGLLTYSHGQLLALEKATPYNHAVTHDLARTSPSHNTVTVDQISQTPGSSLTAAQTPKVTCFYSGPTAAFVEVQADHLYGATSTYRRRVALIEDVIVDMFDARGGKTHDCMLHHAGGPPEFSVAMQPGSFSPAAWLANGSGAVRTATTAADWSARWHVADVTSRLTMAGAADTEIDALETYPVDNAAITPKNPPCQSLCVRRHSDAPFLAVWDAWTNSENLKEVQANAETGAVRLKTAAHEYHLLMKPGHARFQDGLTMSSDAAFAMFKDRDAVLVVAGSSLEVNAGDRRLRMGLDQNASVSAEFRQGVVTLSTAAPIQYDTWGGGDHLRDVPPAKTTFQGDLWNVGQVKTRSPQTQPAGGQK